MAPAATLWPLLLWVLGSAAAPVSGDLTVSRPAVWVDQGRRLAFVGDDDVQPLWYLVGADGTNLEPLITDPPYATPDRTWWSPDGARLAYLADRGGQRTLFIHDLAAEAAQPFALVGAVEPVVLGWSPDSRRLAFSRAADAGAEAAYELAALDADGGGPTWRAPLRVPPQSLIWAPDSNRFAVVAGPRREQHLYIVSVTTLVALLCSPYLAVVPGSVSWSHDGERVAFSASAELRYGGRLYIQAPDRATPAQRAEAPGYLGALPPTWSDDGRWIAWTAGTLTRPERGRLYLAPTYDLRAYRPLARTAAAADGAVFSAGSEWLAYTARRSLAPPAHQVELIRPEAVERVTVVRRGVLTEAPVFNPDGTRLAVLGGAPEALGLHVVARPEGGWAALAE